MKLALKVGSLGWMLILATVMGIEKNVSESGASALAERTFQGATLATVAMACSGPGFLDWAA
ncbi:MAG: hypothetical protein IH965_13390 [Gemmatimonadetes bacterium]|nr:hypothetical protein [Gemmatimonadota bacterium]